MQGRFLFLARKLRARGGNQWLKRSGRVHCTFDLFGTSWSIGLLGGFRSSSLSSFAVVLGASRWCDQCSSRRTVVVCRRSGSLSGWGKCLGNWQDQSRRGHRCRRHGSETCARQWSPRNASNRRRGVAGALC